MNKMQIAVIRNMFKDLKGYVALSKSPFDYYGQCASEKYHDIFGYVLALYGLEIITEKQYDDILDIASNLKTFGIAKKSKIA